MLGREEKEIQIDIEYESLLGKLKDISGDPIRCIWLPQGNIELALALQIIVIHIKKQQFPPKIVVTGLHKERKNPVKLSPSFIDYDFIIPSLLEKYFSKEDGNYLPVETLTDNIIHSKHDVTLFFDFDQPEFIVFPDIFNQQSYTEKLFEIAAIQSAIGEGNHWCFFTNPDKAFLGKQKFLKSASPILEGIYEANDLNEICHNKLDAVHLQVIFKINKFTSSLLKERSQELINLNTTIEEHNKKLEASNEALNKTNKEITVSFSKLKQANSLLKNNEAFINAVFQVADVGLSILDTNGKMIRINREFCNIYLYNENELINLPIANLIPDSDTCKYIEDYNETDVKSHLSEVSKGIRKDGKQIMVLNSTTKVVSEQGESFYINTARDVTKTSRDLHLLHDTLSSLRIGGWEYDLHSNQFFYTEELKNILETGNKKTISKRNITDFIPERAYKELQSAFREISKNRSSFIKEIPAKTAKDNAKILKISARSIYQNNTFIKFAGTVEDITKEKLEARKLKENDQVFQTLIANFPGGTIDIIDQKLNYVFTGGKELEDLPQNPEDVLGKSIYELYDKELAEKLSTYLYRCFKGEQLTFDIDYEGKYWNVFAIPLINESEEIDKVMLLTQNITLQRKADKGLKETHKSLSDFRKALDVASYVAILNENAEFSYLNENLAGLAGYSQEELINRSFEDMLDQNKLVPSFFDEIKETLLNGSIWQGELICKDKSNQNFWLNMSIIPFLDESDNPYQFLAVGNNDTIRKKAEEQIKIQNKELTRINAELDRFVYSTSHDIRSPLVSILGLINIARLELSEGDPVNSYLGMIEKSVKKLDKFVQEIIHYSQNARMEVKYEQIDFENVIQEIFEGLNQVEGFNSIELKINCQSDGSFYTDSNRLKVILNNLLANAILYQRSSIDDPYVEVKVKTNKDLALIEVHDNGIGISHEYIDKVFDMFFKATTFSSGSGLGLYVVKESMNILDGEISVVSKQNDGASFTMNIPNGARDIDIIS